jgi:hypothetical protein
LTILPSTITPLFQTACFEYTLNGQTYTSSGTYDQQYQSAFGCDSIVKLNLIINTVDTNVTQSANVLTSNEVGANYQWIKCNPDTIISGANSSTYIATSNGDYAVIVTKNGCKDTSNCHTVKGLGYIESNLTSEINIYPNPTNQLIHIVNEKDFINASIQLKDITGKLIYHWTAQKGKHLQFDISLLLTGFYILELYDETTRFQFQVIKE